MKYNKKEALRRLYLRISPGENGCTKWSGGKDRDGYPAFWYDGRTGRAARLLWTIIHGEIESHLVIRHTCDNKECLELSHLQLGTATDNNRDTVSRGRWRRKFTGQGRKSYA